MGKQADLDVLVLRGHRWRAIPLSGTRGLVLVTGPGVIANRDGKAWARPVVGSAIVVSGRVSIELRAPASGVAAFLLTRADDALEGASFVVADDQLGADPRLSGIAALLRDHPAPTLVTRYLVEAFTLRARELRMPLVSVPACQDAVVRRAIALVANDLSRRLSTSQLAQAVGLSRAAFARRFAAAMGTPPERYFTAMRLESAARRLVLSEDGLAAIAADLGYGSEFALSRAFKRLYGIAPALYRKQIHSRVGRVEPTRMAA